MATNRITVMEGSSFKVRYTYRRNGAVSYIPEGRNLIIGLYTPKGKLILSGRLNNPGQNEIHITQDENDDYIYVMEFSHEHTVGLIGAFPLEVSVVDDNLDDVKHATSLVTFDFVERKNNSIL